MTTDYEQPIQPEVQDVMNSLAKGLDEILNGKRTGPVCVPRKWGFALLVFPFGETPNDRLNYISNADRRDMVIALKEFVAKNEGLLMPSSKKTH